MNLKRRLIFMSMLTTTIALTFVGIALYLNQISLSRHLMEQRLSTLSQIIATNTSAALAFGDKQAATDTLRTLNQTASTISACIYDTEGNLFSVFNRAEAPEIKCPPAPRKPGLVKEEHGLSVVEPIYLDNRRVGTIYILSDLKMATNQLHLFAKGIALVLVVASLIALAFASFIQRLVSNSILSLTRTAKTIAEKKDYSIRAPHGRLDSRDEIELLTGQFNQMLDHLEERDARLLRSNETLADLLGETQRAVQVRDEFMSIASHELRTPITPIKMQLHTIKRLSERGELSSYPKNKLDRLVQLTDRQLNRLLSLIDELLDVTRISTGTIHLKLSNVDLVALVRDAVARIVLQFGLPSALIEIHSASKVMGYWDAVRLDQVVTNLLVNAVKYGAGKPISVTVRSLEATVDLIVQDHGIGIALEDQKRIFERFERAVPSSHYGGMGLGLYVTNRVVAAHGGEILLHSELGNGATFTVRLPRRAEIAQF
jgi:signal transduction histidine kinase